MSKVFDYEALSGANLDTVEKVANTVNKAMKAWEPLFKHSLDDVDNVLYLIKCSYIVYRFEWRMVYSNSSINEAKSSLLDYINRSLLNYNNVVTVLEPNDIDILVRLARMRMKYKASTMCRRFDISGSINFLDILNKCYNKQYSSVGVGVLYTPVLERLQGELDDIFTTVNESGKLVALYPNHPDCPRGVRVMHGKLGKAVKHLNPELSDEEVKKLVNKNAVGEVRIETSEDAIVHAYTCREGTNWGSCMHNIYVYDEDANAHSPARVYADSDNAGVAVMYNLNGDPMARAVVNRDSMTFSSVYGNYALYDKLVALGYSESNEFSEDLELQRIELLDSDGDSILLAPYIDGSATYVEDYGDYLMCTVHGAHYDFETTDGYVECDNE